MLVSELQSENVDSPMLVTPSGIYNARKRIAGVKRPKANLRHGIPVYSDGMVNSVAEPV